MRFGQRLDLLLARIVSKLPVCNLQSGILIYRDGETCYHPYLDPIALESPRNARRLARRR